MIENNIDYITFKTDKFKANARRAVCVLVLLPIIY